MIPLKLTDILKRGFNAERRDARCGIDDGQLDLCNHWLLIAIFLWLLLVVLTLGLGGLLFRAFSLKPQPGSLFAVVLALPGLAMTLLLPTVYRAGVTSIIPDLDKCKLRRVERLLLLGPLSMGLFATVFLAVADALIGAETLPMLTMWGLAMAVSATPDVTWPIRPRPTPSPAIPIATVSCSICTDAQASCSQKRNPPTKRTGGTINGQNAPRFVKNRVVSGKSGPFGGSWGPVLLRIGKHAKTYEKCAKLPPFFKKVPLKITLPRRPRHGDSQREE